MSTFWKPAWQKLGYFFLSSFQLVRSQNQADHVVPYMLVLPWKLHLGRRVWEPVFLLETAPTQIALKQS